MLPFRSFIQPLCENIVSYGDYHLENKFRHYNHLLFDNKIPPCPITYDSLYKEKAAGITYVTYEKYSRRYIPGTLSIKISNRFKRTEQQIDSTLIHEMIHAYLDTNGHPGAGHGFIFKSQALRCEKIVGFPIPLTDDISDLELADDTSDHVSVLLRKYDDDKWYAAFFSERTFDSTERIHELMAYFGAGKLKTGEELLVLKVHTNLGQKYHMTRLTNLGRVVFKPITEKEYEALITKGQIVRRIEPNSVSSEFAAEKSQKKEVLVLLRTNTKMNQSAMSLYSAGAATKPMELNTIIYRAQNYAAPGVDVAVFTTHTTLLNRGFSVFRDVKKGSYYNIKPEDAEELKRNASYIRHWMNGLRLV